MATAADPLEPLDVSLPDFERPSSPTPYADCFPHQDPDLDFSDPEGEMSESASVTGSISVHGASAGGYSPPAWRRLGNGRRDSGFWRGADNLLGVLPSRPSGSLLRHRLSRPSSPEFESADEAEDDELARAIRTRLPTGSQSPVKGRSLSPDPDRMATTTIRLDDLKVDLRSKSPSMRRRGTSENCKYLASVHNLNAFWFLSTPFSGRVT